MTDQQQVLLDYYLQLSAEDQHSLLRFAEFLATGSNANIATSNSVAIAQNHPEPAASESSAKDDTLPKPENIERPEDEKVVDALKRLSATYPMLEKKTLLNKASELVAQHVMFGKPAVVVINEVEEVFAEAYEKFVEDYGSRK